MTLKERNVEVLYCCISTLVVFNETCLLYATGPDKGQCVCSGPDCACECHCTAAVRSTNNPTCECEDESRCERNVSV